MGDPILYVSNPAGMSRETRRRTLDALRKLNESESALFGDPETLTRIEQYELAYRMQASVPDAFDISKESPEVLEMYGAKPGSGSFANNCLLARRLIEKGVRFVQLYHGGLGQQNRDTWDAHDDVKDNHTRHAAEVDRPISALLTDLKARGLLESTLVLWHGEFGRMPISQKGVGRDHNPGTMTVWMAGAGIKGGVAHGQSDEWAWKSLDPTWCYDLHATILHLLGIDHKKLTFRFQGRDFRLTDVHGELVRKILA